MRALLALCLTVSLLGLAAAQDAPPQGHLVIVGGGGTPVAVRRAALELCGESRRVVVFPQASRLPDRGADAPAFWEDAGATAVEVLDPIEPEAAREALAKADLIWLPGGDQSRLVAALTKADLVAPIRARHRAGAVVAGTSAGAAAMGAWMLTGKADLEAVRAGATELVPGLGLWPEAIVDQHFLARRRNNRLLGAVLDKPTLLGVGIDERTAVVVSGDALRVLGEGGVLVYDARQATAEPTEPGATHAAQGLQLHVLRRGSRLTWRAE
jgi:cyanophycinase